VSGVGPALPGTQQDSVDRYFDATSGYWDDVYTDPGLQGLVYRRRQHVVLDWIAQLGLAPGAPALDAGCGAGHLTVALAGAGLEVVATDSSPEMTERCARSVGRAGVSDHVEVLRADAQRLPFPDRRFALVVALGLLPWLPDPAAAVEELARVLELGGWLIVTADNRRRLNRLIEPREQPLLLPVKQARNAWRRRRGRMPEGAQSRRHTGEEIDAMLTAAGVLPSRRTTVGYGPFSVLGHELLPDTTGLGLHRWLERSAARHARLRAAGWHYVVAGRKQADAGGGR
jgi:ubiquinone/menaquinone biosynthesis C-methylase UbiE